jgi:site-specific recombinase XerD
MREALKKADIKKEVSLHTLRHSYDSFYSKTE